MKVKFVVFKNTKHHIEFGPSHVRNKNVFVGIQNLSLINFKSFISNQNNSRYERKILSVKNIYLKSDLIYFY